jgi:hypothetical protein
MVDAIAFFSICLHLLFTALHRQAGVHNDERKLSISYNFVALKATRFY